MSTYPDQSSGDQTESVDTFYQLLIGMIDNGIKHVAQKMVEWRKNEIQVLVNVLRNVRGRALDSMMEVDFKPMKLWHPRVVVSRRGISPFPMEKPMIGLKYPYSDNPDDPSASKYYETVYLVDENGNIIKNEAGVPITMKLPRVPFFSAIFETPPEYYNDLREVVNCINYVAITTATDLSKMKTTAGYIGYAVQNQGKYLYHLMYGGFTVTTNNDYVTYLPTTFVGAQLIAESFHTGGITYSYDTVLVKDYIAGGIVIEDENNNPVLWSNILIATAKLQTTSVAPVWGNAQTLTLDLHGVLIYFEIVTTLNDLNASLITIYGTAPTSYYDINFNNFTRYAGGGLFLYKHQDLARVIPLRFKPSDEYLASSSSTGTKT